jgi:GntR family transcriptional regulator
VQRPDTIRRIADPVERAKAATSAIAQTQQLAIEYSAITRAAVRELRASGLSLAQVADLLGVTRARIQQLEK